MKSFFSPPLSQKLASLGIKPTRWFSANSKKTTMTEPKASTIDFVRPWNAPAYQMSDVFHKEALRKIFKDGLHKDEFGIQVSNIRDWQYHRDRMIEIYSEEGIEKLEAYLMENI